MARVQHAVSSYFLVSAGKHNSTCDTRCSEYGGGCCKSPLMQHTHGGPAACLRRQAMVRITRGRMLLSCLRLTSGLSLPSGQAAGSEGAEHPVAWRCTPRHSCCWMAAAVPSAYCSMPLLCWWGLAGRLALLG
jgi:hypothetical protein